VREGGRKERRGRENEGGWEREEQQEQEQEQGLLDNQQLAQGLEEQIPCTFLMASPETSKTKDIKELQRSRLFRLRAAAMTHAQL